MGLWVTGVILRDEKFDISKIEHGIYANADEAAGAAVRKALGKHPGKLITDVGVHEIPLTDLRAALGLPTDARLVPATGAITGIQDANGTMIRCGDRLEWEKHGVICAGTVEADLNYDDGFRVAGVSLRHLTGAVSNLRVMA